jgi:type II secretory pathway pseudopilin PulG
LRPDGGFSALEVLFVTALTATVGGIAVPPLLSAVDDVRTTGAVRYLAGTLSRARMEAVLRSADVAVRFTQLPAGYVFGTYVDGNGDGVLSADIQHGIDVRLGSPERLPNNFRGVEFGTLPGLPAVDPGGTPPGSDPIRLGSSNGVTFTAAGTSSTGSIYVLGARNRQFVIRIYGDTGKTRILSFDWRTRLWVPL